MTKDGNNVDTQTISLVQLHKNGTNWTIKQCNILISMIIIYIRFLKKDGRASTILKIKLPISQQNFVRTTIGLFQP